jgi:hypothetical protein
MATTDCPQATVGEFSTGEGRVVAVPADYETILYTGAQ